MQKVIAIFLISFAAASCSQTTYATKGPYNEIDKNWHYICGTCDEESPLFKSECDLIEHIEEEHPEIDTNKKNYTKRTPNNKHICTKCEDSSYSDRDSLYDHIKVKHFLIKHKCALCNKTISRKREVRAHLKKEACKKNCASNKINPAPSLNPKSTPPPALLPAAQKKTILTTKKSCKKNKNSENSEICLPQESFDDDLQNFIENPVECQETALDPIEPIIIQLIHSPIPSTDNTHLKIQQRLKSLFNSTADEQPSPQNISTRFIYEDTDRHNQKHYHCLFPFCDKAFPSQSETLYHILKDHFFLNETEIKNFISLKNLTQNQPALFSPSPKEDESYSVEELLN